MNSPTTTAKPKLYSAILIADKKQYGESYIIKIFENGDDNKESKPTYELDLAIPIKSEFTIKRGFLKVPALEYDLRSDRDQLSEEIAKELLNMDAINRAKERIQDRYSSAIHTTTNQSASDAQSPNANCFRFDIPKMYGRAELKPCAGVGSEAIEGVLYEHATGSNLESTRFGALLEKFIESPQNMSYHFLSFAREMAYAIQKLHNQSIVHSFLVPRNLVAANLEDNLLQISIVGFGYARLGDTTGRDRTKTHKFQIAEADRLYLAPECKNPNDFGSFWFPADIYSIGAILYAILCHLSVLEVDGVSRDNSGDLLTLRLNSVLKEAPRDVPRLKRLIKRNLSHGIADKLIQQNENIIKLVDHCLRYSPEERFSCAEELIELIEIAIDAERPPTGDSQPTATDISKVKAKLAGLGKLEPGALIQALLEPKEAGGPATRTKNTSQFSQNPFLQELMREMRDDFRTDQMKLSGGHIEIYGSRDRIITSLCRMLLVSGKGWEYCTKTIPHYWLEQNLGPLGRFLTMNKHMVRQGLHIKRLFLVDARYFHLLDASEQQMLIDHREAESELENERNQNGSGSAFGNFEVRVLEVEADKINSFERDGNTVGYLLKKDQQNKTEKSPLSLCLSFYSSTSAEWDYGKEYVTRHIKKVRFWVPPTNEEDSRREKFENSTRTFDSEWDTAIPLRKYMSRGYAENSKWRNAPSKGVTSQMEYVLPEKVRLDTLLGIKSRLAFLGG